MKKFPSQNIKKSMDYQLDYQLDYQKVVKTSVQKDIVCL
ncbi:hypothetical protein SAMN06264346_1023 [Chryseobacterium profundimaris]|uniref:Transposase n=1 Tax=Chryseobacterium profundimaris TaxID=1387275 RepID=A0ABY1NH02_9FLAO|nr:hypothetical protein SAMN06264346_1023 [Chryseobacterium profundimaris]